MKSRRKLLAAVSSLVVAAAVLLTGCGAPAQEGTALKETGILTLSVNPEIQIEYNGEGKVTALTGRNDDGKGIVEAYPDYIGKDCKTVLRDLIVEINEAGYFVDDIDGNKKNIVLQLEPGSGTSQRRFSGGYERQHAGSGQGIGAFLRHRDHWTTMTMIPPMPKTASRPLHHTGKKHRKLRLPRRMSMQRTRVFDDKEFDHDDGTPIFELEFMANGNEYEYDIHAVTGKVVKAEHKTAGTQGGTPATGSGSTNYNDTDYGPNNDGVTDYNDTDYGPNNDGVTDYNDTDYGPNNDGVTDYNDTDYGPNNDGVTDYNNTDYGPNNDGVTDYNDTNYDDHGNTNYGDTNYDDGGSDYDREADDDWDDGDSGYDD